MPKVTFASGGLAIARLAHPITGYENGVLSLRVSKHLFDDWLTANRTSIGRHSLVMLVEIDGARSTLLDEIQSLLCTHYVDPSITARRLDTLGAHKTAQLLREHMPTTKTARSGDLGEILATEVAEHILKFEVPIRRLRWKDGRDMALRGDDIIGVRCDANGNLAFLKGESKSRAELTTAVLDEAGTVLDRDRGRPTRHSALFVAERLRDLGNDLLATRIEDAVLESFYGRPVEHLLFTLTSRNPKGLLTSHLDACAKRKRRRHAVGIQIADHAAFINDLFGGL